MENKKYQIVALIGKSGAGKDSIQNVTCRSHPNVFHKIVSCTTRPARDGEQNGASYHFISLEDFTRKVLNGEMLEATEFRGWFYGTPISSLVSDKINIGVFNPAGIEALLEDPRLDVMVIYVDVDDKTRLMRCINREENPDCYEICRRFLTDDEDFAELDCGYTVIHNPDFSSLDLLDLGASAYEDFSYMWSKLKSEASFESAAFWGKKRESDEPIEKIEDNND